ncbi:hypothetical protein LIER_04105 [Lithospermum erythrorhizon]|uniref:Uncharacterized protein n=1 Tax=Lithospermum erythrorhizon TaxID=34254 RepID=A0AAV3NWY3_LITER
MLEGHLALEPSNVLLQIRLPYDLRECRELHPCWHARTRILRLSPGPDLPPRVPEPNGDYIVPSRARCSS